MLKKLKLNNIKKKKKSLSSGPGVVDQKPRRLRQGQARKNCAYCTYKKIPLQLKIKESRPLPC